LWYGRTAHNRPVYASPPYGGSAIMASPKKGDPVQVLEYGAYADWNGITAKWAKVTTSDNKTGWLFSGYLEELRK
jgi:hypothetical protein